MPSVSAEDIIAGGDILAETLNASTGLTFNVSVGSSYASTIEEMCASTDNTIGFIPAQGYVLANDLCGVDIQLKSVRFGYTEYWTQFIVARDSEITDLSDLAGAKWAYPDATSTSGFLVPSGVFRAEGIEVGDSFEAGSHGAVGTTFYSPQVDADRNVLWDGTAEGADLPDDVVETCALDADGQIECDGVFPRDARRDIREEAPDVIQKVRIVTLSDPIPNDGMAFGPDFPADLKVQIVDAMKAFAESDPDAFEAAFDAYSWSGVDDTQDSEFDSIRALLDALGYSLEDF